MVCGKPSAKDYLLTVFIFAVCTLIGLLFQKLDLTDTNIVTIYILGVLITSIVTDGYLCSDVRTKKLRQVVTAVSDGANAVMSAEDYLLKSNL